MKVQDVIKEKIGIAEKRIHELTEAGDLKKLSERQKHQISSFYDKKSLISVLTLDKADELLDSGFIGGGMLPKLKNCVDAVRNGVSRVHILDGRIEHCLLLEFFTNRGIGTAIIDKESIFEHETVSYR